MVNEAQDTVEKEGSLTPTRAPIMVVPYDPLWADEFAALQIVLRTVVGNLAQAIEHIGSTSVPGLAAKPVIDVDIIIPDHATFALITERLATLGYTHQGDLKIPGRESYKRQDAHVPYTTPARAWMQHHLYVCYADAPALRNHLCLRDYLRAHPETAQEYAALKFALAERYRDDREAYNVAKTEFILNVLQKAGVDITQDANFTAPLRP